jgi:hypothetical protein
MSHSFDSFSSKEEQITPDLGIEKEIAFNKISSKKNTSSEKADDAEKQ